MYGRYSWYDRNSNYNNYFDNLSTGEWFQFISRQAAFDHVYVLNATTVLNLRYGYNWFVRGTDTNPANHGFDLTTLGFPASYNAAIPDDIRRFPRFDITGYQGTGFGGEYRPNETQSFLADLNKSIGRPLDAGPAWSSAATARPRSSSPTTRPASSTSTRRGRAVRSTTRPRRPDRWGSRSPRSCSACRAPAASRGGELRRGLVHVWVLRPGRLAGRPRLTLNLGLRYEVETPLAEADNRSVRGFDAGRGPADRGGGARRAEPAATGVPLESVQGQGRTDVRGRRTASRRVSTRRRRTTSCRGSAPTYKLNDQTVAARRLRHVLRVPRPAPR